MLVGLFGDYGVEAGITRAISKNSKAGFGIEIGTTGIFFNVTFHRGGQKYALPLQIAEEVTPKGVLFAVLVPAVVLTLTKVLLINPIKDKRKKK